MQLYPLSANSTKWSNTHKQFVGKLPTNCLSVSDHFVELARKGYIRNKFDSPVTLVISNLGLFMISARKTDAAFPNTQFFYRGILRPLTRSHC